MQPLLGKDKVVEQRRGSPIAVRLSEQPTLSVVVTSCGERARLDRCLNELVPRCAAVGVEVLVVRIGNDSEEIENLTATHPSVRFTVAPAPVSVADLRQRGLSEAEGDVVIIRSDEQSTEDWLPPRLLPKQREP